MCLAFSRLDQQCVSNQGVLEVKLCPCNSKVIGKVSNHRFLDYDFWDIDWPKNGSHDVKYSLRKLVLLRCKSTQLAVQLHHEDQFVLNLLGSELVPSFVTTCNLCCPPSHTNILLRQWFSNADMPLVPYMCFFDPRGCIKFNPDHCCNLDPKAP